MLRTDGKNEADKMLQIQKGVIEVAGRMGTQNLVPSIKTEEVADRMIAADIDADPTLVRTDAGHTEDDGSVTFAAKRVMRGRDPRRIVSNSATDGERKLGAFNDAMFSGNYPAAEQQQKAYKEAVEFLSTFGYKENAAKMKNAGDISVLLHMVTQKMNSVEFQNLLRDDTKFKASFNNLLSKLKMTQQENYFAGEPPAVLLDAIKEVLDSRQGARGSLNPEDWVA